MTVVQARTERKRLTATLLRMNPPQDVKHVEIRDTASPLIFRVTRQGHRSLSLRTSLQEKQLRFAWQGTIDPAGDDVPDVATVRSWANEIVSKCKKGIDPRVELLEAERQERAEQRRREQEVRQAHERETNTFGAMVERWLSLVVVGPDESKPRQRQGLKVAREVRRYLVERWDKRPLAEVTRKDVIELVDDLEGRGTPAMARNVLGHAKAFFNWCISRDLLEHSPADRVRLSTKKKPRQRVLDDLELRAFVRNARRLDYPFGPFFEMVLLTGQRREEVAAARWRELHPELLHLLRQRQDGEAIDWSAVSDDYKLWTVGAERFKSDAPHIVPLTDTVCRLLESLPFFAGGDYLFSGRTFGRRPISGFSRAKTRLDARMALTLKAYARQRGEDPRQVTLEGYVVHDLRRTMRTRMAGLRVPDEVAEKCIGHARKGLQRVYDQHRYLPEMREAFELWHRKLDAIVAPGEGRVVLLRDAI